MLLKHTACCPWAPNVIHSFINLHSGIKLHSFIKELEAFVWNPHVDMGLRGSVRLENCWVVASWAEDSRLRMLVVEF